MARFVDQAFSIDQSTVGRQNGLSERLRTCGAFQDSEVKIATGHHRDRRSTRDGVEDDEIGQWSRAAALLLAGALDINRSAVSQVVSSRSVGSQIHPMWRRRSDVEVLAAHEFMFRTRMDHEPYRDLPVADLLASMDDHNDVSMVGRRPAAVTLLVPCFRVRVFRLRQRASTATDRAAARSRFLGPRAVLIAHADSKPTLSLGDGPVGTPSARWSPRE